MKKTDIAKVSVMDEAEVAKCLTKMYLLRNEPLNPEAVAAQANYLLKDGQSIADILKACEQLIRAVDIRRVGVQHILEHLDSFAKERREAERKYAERMEVEGLLRAAYGQ